MISKSFETLCKDFRYAGDMARDVALLQEVQHLESNCTADGMARIGRAVPEEAKAFAARFEPLIDLARECDGRQGLISGSQTFGDTHRVGTDACGLATPERAGAVESVDDLVIKEQNVIFRQDGLNLGVIS